MTENGERWLVKAKEYKLIGSPGDGEEFLIDPHGAADRLIQRVKLGEAFHQFVWNVGPSFWERVLHGSIDRRRNGYPAWSTLFIKFIPGKWVELYEEWDGLYPMSAYRRMGTFKRFYGREEFHEFLLERFARLKRDINHCIETIERDKERIRRIDERDRERFIRGWG